MVPVPLSKMKPIVENTVDAIQDTPAEPVMVVVNVGATVGATPLMFQTGLPVSGFKVPGMYLTASMPSAMYRDLFMPWKYPWPAPVALVKIDVIKPGVTVSTSTVLSAMTVIVPSALWNEYKLSTDPA